MGRQLEADVALLGWLNAPRGLAVDAVLLTASRAGEDAFVWWVLLGRRWNGRLAAWTAVAVVVSVLVTNSVTFLWNRERPSASLEGVRRPDLMWTNDPFPSGHAICSFAAATVLS